MLSQKRLYNWYIGLVAAGCMVLVGYDSSVFNSVQNSEHWAEWFDNPTGELLGLINTTYNIVGIIFGCFASGPITDIFGRRVGMGLGCLMTVVATFIQTFAPYHKVGVFLLGRIIIGAGQGVVYAAGPTYIGEVTPASIRGKVMACWQMFYSVGSFFAYWINYATSEHSVSLGQWDWKLVVILQMVLPIMIMVQLPFMPESPRWYVQRKNNTEAARKVLSQIRETEEEVEVELLMIREAIAYEKETVATGLKAYKELWSDRSIFKRVCIGTVLNVGQQLSGQGTLNSYSSTIYKQVFTNSNTRNLINALNASFGILFTLNATWIVDRFGRRFLFIVGAIGMASCTLIIAMVGLETPNVDGGKSHPVGVAIVFLMFLFILFYKPSWGATTWIYTAEMFPMHVRAQATSMCAQMQGVANTIFGQFFPTFYANCGLKTFFFFMTCNLCLALFVYFVLPETKKVPLEEIDVLFGGANHVEKGAAMLADGEFEHSTVQGHSTVQEHSTDKRDEGNIPSSEGIELAPRA